MRRSHLVVVFAALFALAAPSLAKSPLGEALKDIDVADHWIYDDWPRALKEARITNKPLLVVIRCVPCPPGKTLDTAVMQPDAELKGLEKNFVCVRIIQANRLDLNLFQFDYDMSWAAMFLNADLTIYGRYGSRNATGPQSDGLLSAAAFRKAAERALELHKNFPDDKGSLLAKAGPKSEYTSPTQIPGLTDRPSEATARNNCVHCHMVKEYTLRAKWEAGTLKATDLYVFPLPNNLGLTMDLDDGLRVKSVAEGSAAAEAGLRAGDELISFDHHPLISLADIQWALNAAPLEGRLPIEIRRNGKAVDKSILPRSDWKKSDIAWRASSWYGLRQGLKVEPLAEAEKSSRGLAAGSLALVVKGLFGKGAPKLQEAGLMKDDVIVVFDGQSKAMTESDFLVQLRLRNGPKDSVNFTVLRGSERKKLTVPMW